MTSEKNDGNTYQTSRRMIAFAGLIGLALYLLYNAFSEKWEAKEIKENHLITQGWITSYRNTRFTDLLSKRKITYAYQVDEELFSRQVGSQLSFPECKPLGAACTNKRFWVIYAKDHPDRSLINLTVDIQKQSDPTFPEALDDFH